MSGPNSSATHDTAAHPVREVVAVLAGILAALVFALCTYAWLFVTSFRGLSLSFQTDPAYSGLTRWLVLVFIVGALGTPVVGLGANIAVSWLIRATDPRSASRLADAFVVAGATFFGALCGLWTASWRLWFVGMAGPQLGRETVKVSLPLALEGAVILGAIVLVGVLVRRRHPSNNGDT